MNTQTKLSTSRNIVLRWVINLVWIVLWTVLYFMCINVFSNTVAFIGIPALIVTTTLVWFITERRNRQALEKAP